MSARALLRRMGSTWGLLVAVAVMATVSTTLTALVPIYSNSIVDAGFRQAIEQAPPESRTLSLTLRTTSDAAGAQAATAAATADGLLAGASDAAMFAESGSYAFPDGDESTITALATVYEVEGEPADDAGVVGGDLFDVVEQVEPTGLGIAAALHVDAAAFLGVAPGDVVDVESRDDGARLEVVALLAPAEASDPRWIDDEFGRAGVRSTVSFTEVGPFFLSPADLAGRAEQVTLRGRFALEADEVSTGDIDTIVAGVEGARPTFANDLASREVRLDGDLAGVLGTIDTTVRTTGAVVGIVLLQLIAVALFGLGVAASVLARAREEEVRVVLSRGSSRRQLAVSTLAEAAIVVLPAALLGPPLAVMVVRLIGSWDPIEATGLDLRGTMTPVSFLASFGVAAVAIAVVVATALSSARPADRSRGSLLQRTGLDIAILAAAVVGLWQLGRADSVTSASTADGQASLDPVLAIAPVLGVVAASLLALRLVSLAAAGILRFGTRSRRLVPALAGWDLVRQPSHRTRTSVLIVVAVSIGVFAAVHADSWQRSLSDQADAAAGSDVTVVPDARPDAELGPQELAGAYGSVPGVTGVLPIATRAADFGGGITNVVVVSTETERLDGFSRLRDDLRASPRALLGLAAPIDVGGAALPSGGALTASVTVDVAVDDADIGSVDVAVIVRDRYGTIERLASSVAADGTARDVTFGDVASGADGGVNHLVGIEVTSEMQFVALGTAAQDIPPPVELTIEISDLAIGGAPVDVSGTEWRVREVTTDGSTTRIGDAEAAVDGQAVVVAFDPGTNRRPQLRSTARFTTAPIDEGAPQQDVMTVDALATPGLLGATQLAVGDEANVRIGGLRVIARIAGTAQVVPYATEERLALLVDRSTLSSVEYTSNGTAQPPDRWALNVGEDRHREVSAALETAPFDSAGVDDRRIEAERRSRDPVLIGLTGSLFAAVVAAAVVVVLGLGLTAITDARERRRGYAVLSALGTNRRELRRLLARETVPLAVLSTACGVVAGLVLAEITVSSLATDPDGSAALPVPELVVPWPTLVGYVAGTLVVVAMLPLLTGRLLRGVRPADEIRIGDQR